MKKKLTPPLLALLIFLFANTTFAQVKMGDNVTNVGTSSLLELESTSRAFVLNQIANTALIVNPVDGMLVYDMSANCIKGYSNGAWTGCMNTLTPSMTSSNGSAVVTAYSCATASAGTMTVGTAVSGVTQTITATVTSVGTYSISTTANGVTFFASGTFSGTGAQPILLTASGTPMASGTHLFILNTTPNCSFSR